jgi:hypothetical protein
MNDSALHVTARLEPVNAGLGRALGKLRNMIMAGGRLDRPRLEIDKG